jgi:hypothetical protein
MSSKASSGPTGDKKRRRKRTNSKERNYYEVSRDTTWEKKCSKRPKETSWGGKRRQTSWEQKCRWCFCAQQKNSSYIEQARNRLKKEFQIVECPTCEREAVGPRRQERRGEKPVRRRACVSSDDGRGGAWNVLAKLLPRPIVALLTTAES